MRSSALHALTERLSEDGRISADEALDLRRAIFPDGVVSREEAEILIALESRVANSDPAWAQAFAEAIADHALQSGAYPGHVDETTAGWLEARFGRDGARETEVETLLKALERSESAPERLSEFTRERVADLAASAPIGPRETDLIRRCLYAASGSGAIAITEDEARWLFVIDAESDGRANDPAWRDLFVKAILNHLLGRRAPALLKAEGMLAGRAWLTEERPSSPLSFLSRAFEGGLEGYRRNLGLASDVDRLEAHYEAANAEAEEDARLTLSEIAWAVGMTKQDGKTTENEKALLTEIRTLESA